MLTGGQEGTARCMVTELRPARVLGVSGFLLPSFLTSPTHPWDFGSWRFCLPLSLLCSRDPPRKTLTSAVTILQCSRH